MTIKLLTQICEILRCVCYFDHEAKMFKSAFCLAFFGLFRIGELVCANKETAHKAVLMINDIDFKQNSMRVVIRYSKTDQIGRTATIIIEGNTASTLCPVQATKEYIQSRCQYAGPLYCHFNRTFLSLSHSIKY